MNLIETVFTIETKNEKRFQKTIPCDISLEGMSKIMIFPLDLKIEKIHLQLLSSKKSEDPTIRKCVNLSTEENTDFLEEGLEKNGWEKY